MVIQEKVRFTFSITDFFGDSTFRFIISRKVPPFTGKSDQRK